jgi:drug/metabolite transporter (DMT)-like permease
MLRTFVLAIISIVLLATGQSLLKLGLSRAGGVNFSGGDVLAGFQTILTSPYIVMGFLFYGVSSLTWLDVLSKLEISKAFPMISLTYVITLVVGGMFFDETITWTRILGVLVIITGVALVARS